MSNKPIYKNKINRIRSFALILVFIGFGFMYAGLLLKKIEWLMLVFFAFGVLAIVLSTFVYFWIGMISTKSTQVICPNCENATKILGRVDACMHCQQPLTLDKDLEGKEFHRKYNRPSYKKK